MGPCQCGEGGETSDEREGWLGLSCAYQGKITAPPIIPELLGMYITEAAGGLHQNPSDLADYLKQGEREWEPHCLVQSWANVLRHECGAPTNETRELWHDIPNPWRKMLG